MDKQMKKTRDFKFRAWDLNLKKMINNFVLAPTIPQWTAFPIEYSKDLEKYQNIVREKIAPLVEEDWKWDLSFFTSSDYSLFDWANYYGSENYEVMQWIGLWDKNKKDIYEGDIVIFDDSEIGGERVTGIVVFNDDQTLGPLAWGLWTKRGYMHTDFLGHIEVIGNEYENQDLWEKL